MDTVLVTDEFECQLKCMGNNNCKSCNLLPGDSSGNRICRELNSKTWQMKPGDLKPRKGTTYYSSVQVSFFFALNFQLIRLILIKIMLTKNVWYFVYIVRPCLNMLGCEG